ncbi:MAG: ribonuclease R [Burkholderiaceae bacterium]|nr:MAG: ribonuclease R [Burkholderiaceae bacterium]
MLGVLRSAPIPLTSAQLALKLKVGESELPGFEKRLAAMERDGQLMPNRKGVLLLATKLDFIAGKVTGHRDGYGFLVRDDNGPDVYLGAREMLKVLHGDRVLVRITGTDKRGKPEGTIVEVIERRTNKLVGRLLSERGVYVVAPEDQRIKHDILIPPGEVRHAQPGQVVTVEILEQPSRYSQPMGRVVEVLGEIGDPGMEIEIAVRKFDVPHEFSLAAEKLAEKLPSEVRKKDLSGRIDLRDVPLVTIDGEDARDFDDAVYCEPIELTEGKRKSAGWRLLVAIADVSHYVTPGDAIDLDARDRSTSVYFPRRVIPMLPEKLSNGLCSLNPAVDRLTLVCDMVVNMAGLVKGYQFYPAVIHSAARLTYNEVWAALSAPEGQMAQKYAALMPQLQNLHALHKVFAQARTQRGAIELETVETYIECNELGKIERIVPRTRNDAHKLIEECMLAANVCAADFMERSKHLGLFRVHEGPTPDKLNNLRAFLKTINLQLDGGDDPQPSDYARLMDKIKRRPDAPLLTSMILRSMQQAIYTPDNSGHFGLAYQAYAHFTSPIRRYPDLLTHRVIKALLAGKHYVPQPLRNSDEYSANGGAQNDQKEVWEQLGILCSANERRADDASRDVQAWLKCFYMKERVGEQFAGTVTGVAPFGVFVTLNDLFVEGMVHVSELGTEYFNFNEAMHELRGERSGLRYRLTDAIQVQVARVDLEARKIEFRLVKGLSYKQVMNGVTEDEIDQPMRRARKAAPPKPDHLKTTKPPAKVVRGKARGANTAKAGTPARRKK